MIRNKVMRLLAGFALGLLVSLGVAHAGEAIEGSAKADKLESCVRDTPFMRRNHFELIKHQRDITVHEGIRKTEDSMHGCVDCHVRHDAEGQPVPINAPGEFCATCHTKTAVSIDCFTCHANVPTPKNPGKELLEEVKAYSSNMDPEMIEKAHEGIESFRAAQATGN